MYFTSVFPLCGLIQRAAPRDPEQAVYIYNLFQYFLCEPQNTFLTVIQASLLNHTKMLDLLHVITYV